MVDVLRQKPRFQIPDQEFESSPSPEQPNSRKAEAVVSKLKARARSRSYDARGAVATQSRKFVVATTKLHVRFGNRRSEILCSIQ